MKLFIHLKSYKYLTYRLFGKKQNRTTSKLIKISSFQKTKISSLFFSNWYFIANIKIFHNFYFYTVACAPLRLRKHAFHAFAEALESSATASIDEKGNFWCSIYWIKTLTGWIYQRIVAELGVANDNFADCFELRRIRPSWELKGGVVELELVA